MMSKPEKVDLIPTRLRLTGPVARAAAKLLFDQLVGGWGLANGSKIVSVLSGMLRDEKKRRKKLEGGG